MTLLGLLMIVLLIVFILIGLALYFRVVFFHSSWGHQVDRIHELFISRGLLPNRVSQIMKVLEKGFVLPLAIAAAIMISGMDLTVLVLRLVLGLRI